MWKSLTIVVLCVVLSAGWWTRAHAQEAGNDAAPPDAANRVADNDLARRAARDFAPWIEALILQKSEKANRLFPLRHPAQETVDSQNSLRIFREFLKMDSMEISLVGGRTLNEQAGVLLFTALTEHGPVAFKIYHYKFGSDRFVGKVDISDDWSEIERMYLTIDPLQNPVTVPL